MLRAGVCAAAAVFAGSSAAAQTTPPAPYGAPIPLERAKQVLAGAEAEARRTGLAVAIAIVEPSGQLMLFSKGDGANYSAIEVAQDKARSAALFRLSTAVWDQAASAPNGAWVLGLRGAVPIEGGIPIVSGGRTVGAIGVSGGSSTQDAQVARAGAAAAL